MERKETQPDRSRDTDALRAACGREGCPICAVILDQMQGVMDSWQYEDFTDVEHRHEVIRTRGFCPLHTWQLAQLHTPFQLAVIYREVLTDVLAALERDQENMQGTSPRAALALPGWLKGQHAHSD